jgi:hypothetical protein
MHSEDGRKARNQAKGTESKQVRKRLKCGRSAGLIARRPGGGWLGRRSAGRADGDRGRMRGVVVSLDVCIRKRLAHAGDDRLKSQLRSTSESVWQDVSGGNLDGLLEEIMLEDDETCVHRRGVAHNVLPVLENLAGCDSSCVDVVVSGVKRGEGAKAGPHDGRQTHCQGDSSNPIINVAEGRSHSVWCDTQDILDNFLAPPKLSDNLFVREGCKGRSMAPGVHGDMMLAHVLDLKNGREGNCARTDDKERGLERILVEEVQEVGSVVRGSVIVCETPCVLCRTIRNVSLTNTPTTRPPTTGGVRGSLWVGWAPSGYSNANVWDLHAGRLNLGNPLFNQCAVGGRNDIERGVIGGDDG